MLTLFCDVNTNHLIRSQNATDEEAVGLVNLLIDQCGEPDIRAPNVPLHVVKSYFNHGSSAGATHDLPGV